MINYVKTDKKRYDVDTDQKDGLQEEDPMDVDEQGVAD